MASTLSDSKIETLADMVGRLGGIPLERIRFDPLPGSATEDDVLRRRDGEKRLCELVDAALVEKPMGYYESRVAAALIFFLETFLQQSDLGIVLAPDATIRLARGLVRLPDVSFISWERFPDRQLPAGPILDVAPDLAVEILSESNTPREMARKVGEYFDAGTGLVWVIDPATHRATVYTASEDRAPIDESGRLDGVSVLPGFSLPLARLFERAGRQALRTSRQEGIEE